MCPKPELEPRYSVLALHGFTGSGADFEPLVKGWPHPARWCCPDLPGHGGHRVDGDPTRCSVNATLASLSALIAAIPAPRVLLGYSMGARAALHLALADPGPWSALVLVGPNPGISDKADRRQRLESDARLARTIRSDGTAAFLERWRETPLIASQRRIDPQILGPMDIHRAGCRPADLAASLEGFGAAACPPLWPRLADLKLPALLVAGDEDAKYRGIVERMSEGMQDAQTVTVPGAGHMAHLENPAAFMAAGAEFLAGRL